jgi:rod shape-determining protein MreC
VQVRTRTWLSLVIAVSLLFIVASRFAVFDPLENAAQSTAAPIESSLRDATRPLADFVNNLTDVDRLTGDNQALREENERLLREIARLRESEREAQQFRQLVDIRGAEAEGVLIEAHVFAREPSNLQDRIAIDRGTSDGVRKDMIVLSPLGSLVGIVTEALDDVAWVTLITDPSSAISALIQESRVQGVVVGAADGTLTMEFVEETADVKQGDLVLTSAIGGRVPPGELIGQVVRVESAAQELFKSVRVQPLADFSRLERVLVLESFLPSERGGE